MPPPPSPATPASLHVMLILSRRVATRHSQETPTPVDCSEGCLQRRHLAGGVKRGGLSRDHADLSMDEDTRWSALYLVSCSGSTLPQLGAPVETPGDGRDSAHVVMPASRPKQGTRVSTLPPLLAPEPAKEAWRAPALAREAARRGEAR